MKKSDLRILIVDDDPVDIELIILKLNKNGYTNIKTAYKGEDAIIVCKDYFPHITVIDACMQGMDGYDVCEEIKKIPGINTLIYGMTGFANEKILRSFNEVGVNYVIDKNKLTESRGLVDKLNEYIKNSPI